MLKGYMVKTRLGSREFVPFLLSTSSYVNSKYFNIFEALSQFKKWVL